jgi:hypothetical protein
MAGAGFAVTKYAPRAHKRWGGWLDKAWANRRNRRHVRQELHVHGEDAEVTMKLWTDWDVV